MILRQRERPRRRVRSKRARRIAEGGGRAAKLLLKAAGEIE